MVDTAMHSPAPKNSRSTTASPSSRITSKTTSALRQKNTWSPGPASSPRRNSKENWRETSLTRDLSSETSRNPSAIQQYLRVQARQSLGQSSPKSEPRQERVLASEEGPRQQEGGEPARPARGQEEREQGGDEAAGPGAEPVRGKEMIAYSAAKCYNKIISR